MPHQESFRVIFPDGRRIIAIEPDDGRVICNCDCPQDCASDSLPTNRSR